MTIKLAHSVVTFLSPIGEKNVTTIQNLEWLTQKGVMPKRKNLDRGGSSPTPPPPTLGSTIALGLCIAKPVPVAEGTMPLADPEGQQIHAPSPSNFIFIFVQFVCV